MDDQAQDRDAVLAGKVGIDTGIFHVDDPSRITLDTNFTSHLEDTLNWGQIAARYACSVNANASWLITWAKLEVYRSKTIPVP